MLTFATEFPVKRLDDHRTAFVTEVVAWLQGARWNSTVLSADPITDLDSENVHLRSKDTGEELQLRELRYAGSLSAIGFRHDNPDDEGRLWRTESVLRKDAANGNQSLVRLRTQCLAHIYGAHLQSPLKPYLIKSFLKNGWGGNDQAFTVADQPIWLRDDDKGLETARMVALGEATKWLPVVYISAVTRGWSLGKREIGKLAYDLGGVAHVVVEPNRGFSFRLRDESEGQNVYGGAIGLVLPERGLVRRYRPSWRDQDSKGLAAAVQTGALILRGHMPSLGWDWSDLHEQALRLQRKGQLTAKESEALYLEEINTLKDKIDGLEERIATLLSSGGVGTDDDEFLTNNFSRRIGPEIYSGEILDRLRFAAKQVLSESEKIGLDLRSKIILQRVVDRIPRAPDLNELIQDLSRAAKKSKHSAKGLASLLARHGYREKSDNRHVRLEAEREYDGLEGITLPKTPSDKRNSENTIRTITRAMGINKLPK